MAGLEKDTAGDMGVCTVVVAETCNRFQKDSDAGDEEDTTKVEQIIKKAAYEGHIAQYEANTIYSKMSTRPHCQKRKRQRF